MSKSEKPEKNVILYILMRTDLDSLNPGKAMAQACHAANDMQEECQGTDLYDSWKSQSTMDSFGTTIVLDGGSIDNIRNIILHQIAVEGVHTCGVITDDTYPISDGAITHLVPLETCAWILVDINDKDIKKVLSKLDLHK